METILEIYLKLQRSSVFRVREVATLEDYLIICRAECQWDSEGLPAFVKGLECASIPHGIPHRFDAKKPRFTRLSSQAEADKLKNLEIPEIVSKLQESYKVKTKTSMLIRRVGNPFGYKGTKFDLPLLVRDPSCPDNPGVLRSRDPRDGLMKMPWMISKSIS
jgi:hypothetical protein